MRYRIREARPGRYRVEQKGGLWWTSTFDALPFLAGGPKEFTDLAEARTWLGIAMKQHKHKPRVIEEHIA